MRRRRKPLEVSTFPFLAVLLCAMGSLIFVLLVMDRKAKMGARQKAIAALARAAEEAEHTAAARRAELERHLQEKRAEQQAEWEKKRDALHKRLLTEQQALQLQMQQLRDKMTLAAARLRLEQEQAGEAKKQVAAEQTAVQGATQALVSTKQTIADTQTHTEQEKAALARMTNDLVVLERALQDLKETRERERQTYSVVPYNGKRGESRRPMYIECAGDYAIFHPDKKAVLVQANPGEIRAEVARRVAHQREQLAAAKMPVDQTPYLMLLVRPDGIYSYYAFEAALAGLDVQFGYELIDADWLLDFPEDNKPGTQAWQALAKTPQLPPLDPPPPSNTKVHGVQFHKIGPLMQAGAAGPRGNTANGSGASAGGHGGSGMGSDNPLSPGGLGRPVAMGDAVGTNGGTGAPLPGQTPRRGYRGIYSDGRSPIPGQEGNGNGGGTVLPGSPTGPQVLAQGSNGPPGHLTGGESNPANVGFPGGNGKAGPSSATGPQTQAQGNPPPDSPSANGNPGNSATVPATANRETNPNLPPLPPWLTQGSGGAGGGASGASGSAGGGTNQGGGQPAPPGDSGGGSSEGQPQSILRPARIGGRQAKQPQPMMHAARLGSDRDYVIFLECRRNSVVLYPSQREFLLASLNGGPNDPLVRALQQMIDRRQSGVRPGDVPYRPQIRFLVRPQTLRAFHTVYPLLDALPATKTRQNLIPEDDVRAIIGGN